MSIFKHFKISQFPLYISSYGGYKAVLKSPYLYYSTTICLIVIIFGNPSAWQDFALDILPNIVGFTIGAYAILLSINSEKLLKLLTKEDTKEEITPYMQISGTFCHFVFVQTITIMLAYVSKSLCITNLFISILGTFLFIYALMLILATTFAILFLSKWIKTASNIDDMNRNCF